MDLPGKHQTDKGRNDQKKLSISGKKQKHELKA